MWPWALMMPGMMVLPVRSITCAPAGVLRFAAGPIAGRGGRESAMGPSRRGGAPVPSMRVAWVRTVVWAKAPRAAASSGARIRIRLDHDTLNPYEAQNFRRDHRRGGRGSANQ